MKKIVVLISLITTCIFSNDWITIFDNNDLSSGGSIVQTADRSLLIGGVVMNKASINKVDSNGKLVWSRKYSILDSYSDIDCYPSVLAIDILDLGLDGYVFCGIAVYTDTLMRHIEFGYITMVNNNGNVIWEKEYDIKRLVRIFKTEDGYIAFGTKHPDLNISLSTLKAIKIDNFGEVIWEKEYTKSDVLPEIIVDGLLFPQIEKLSNNCYVISSPGRMRSDDSSDSCDAIMITINENGEVLKFNSYFSGGGTQLMFPTELRDHNLLFTGLVYNRETKTYISYLLKTNVEGDTLWIKTYQSANLSYSFHNVVKVPNGDILIYGIVKNNIINESDAYIVRIDPYGNIKDEYYFGGSNSGYINNAIAISDSIIVILGTMFQADEGYNAYIAAIKIHKREDDRELIMVEEKDRETPEKETADLPSEIFFIASPNPFNSRCSFKFSYEGGTLEEYPRIKIFNIIGNLIHEIPASSRESDLIWQPHTDIPSGKYLASCVVGRKKMVKLITYLK